MQDEDEEKQGLSKNPTIQESKRRIWHSCCFECDRDVVMYSTKTIFSASILAFSMYIVLTNTDPCKDLAFPTGLIGAILGSFAEQGSQRMSSKD